MRREQAWYVLRWDLRPKSIGSSFSLEKIRPLGGRPPYDFQHLWAPWKQQKRREAKPDLISSFAGGPKKGIGSEGGSNSGGVMWKSGSVFQGLCVWRLSVWNYGTDGSWQETSGGQQCEHFVTWALKTDVRCTLNQSGNLNLAFKAKKQGLKVLTIRSSFLWYIIWKHRTPINIEN